MKKLLTLIAVFILIGTQFAAANKVVPSYYIQGYFFKDSPDNLPDGYSLMSVSYGDGKRLFIISYPQAVALSDDIIAKSIPSDDVADKDLIWPMITSSVGFYAVMAEAGKNREWLNVGTAFPSFTATDIDGVECRSKDIEGKVMVLNLWYTGCGPCRREMPELSTWREKYPDVVFLSSTWESPEVARPVLEKCGFTWRHIVNDRQFLKWLNGRGYPMTIVVDKKGIVRHYENGTNQDKLAAILQAIEAARNETD